MHTAILGCELPGVSTLLRMAKRDAPGGATPAPACGDPTPAAASGHPPEAEPVAAPGSTVFVCPAEAGQVDHAQLWYYCDHAGVEQGPFSMLSMRSWYEAGYFEGGVTVAASYFGEVPLQYWQIAELWEVPLSQAFVPAAGVETIVEAPVADPEFIPSVEFAGAPRTRCACGLHCPAGVCTPEVYARLCAG